MKLTRNLLPIQGKLYYIPHVFSEKEADLYFEQLKNDINWRQDEIMMFGRKVMQPRLTAWYGDAAYTYSGITMHPEPWTDTLLAIKDKVESYTGTGFNSVLLNFYRDGKDHMGWHRDNEKGLGEKPVIASVSFGAVRAFQIRRYATKDDKLSIEVENGSLILMQGEMQQHWEHQLPKRLKVKEPRINLTFRTVYPAFS